MPPPRLRPNGVRVGQQHERLELRLARGGGRERLRAAATESLPRDWVSTAEAVTVDVTPDRGPEPHMGEPPEANHR